MCVLHHLGGLLLSFLAVTNVLKIKAHVSQYREAYALGKKERPPFVPHDQSSSEDDSDPIPDELLCPICNDLMTDAVVIPCCGNSYCDDCKFSLTMCMSNIIPSLQRSKIVIWTM